jgi:hypothetical protein
MFSSGSTTGVKKLRHMTSRLLKFLGELLLPERYEADQAVPKEPIEALISAYNQLLQLAAQIGSHAEAAPYPHVAKRLHNIAAEKRASAQRLKNVIDSRRAWVPEAGKLTVAGKNHWERLGHDLADQRAFENFLARSEPRLSAEFPEVAEFLLELRNSQVAHREALAELIALADPQATQT